MPFKSYAAELKTIRNSGHATENSYYTALGSLIEGLDSSLAHWRQIAVLSAKCANIGQWIRLLGASVARAWRSSAPRTQNRSFW